MERTSNPATSVETEPTRATIEPPKKKRGRPPGSKNRPRDVRVQGQSARPNVPVNEGLESGLYSFDAHRFLGVQHRSKKTTSGEERPTRVCVFDGDGKPIRYTLDTTRAEVDFAAGLFPVEFRGVEPDEDVSSYPRPWQLKVKELPASAAQAIMDSGLTDAMLADVNAGKFVFCAGQTLVLRRGKSDKRMLHLVTALPCAFDGLKSGDLVGMSLGGSGDGLAVLLHAYGQACGAMIARTPPSILKDRREALKQLENEKIATQAPTEEPGDEDADGKNEKDKDRDDVLLSQLVCDERQSFYAVTRAESVAIAVRLAWRRIAEIMPARIAMKQRLITAQRARAYISADPEHFPAGDLEAMYLDSVASDAAYLSLVDEEARADRELELALQQVPIYREILSRVDGIGKRLAGRILCAMGDPARFTSTRYDVEIATNRSQILDLRQACNFEQLLPEVFALRDDSGKPRFKGTQNIADRSFNWWQATQFARNIANARFEAAHEDADCATYMHRVERLDAILELMRSNFKLNDKRFRHSRSKFISYNGLNPDKDTGKFRKRQKGHLANWSGTGRQTGYLFANQVLKLPTKLFGRYLIAVKARIAARHPAVVKEGKFRKYTPGHIQKMAFWRVATRFFEWFFGEVWRFNKNPAEYRFREPEYPALQGLAVVKAMTNEPQTDTE